MVHNTKGKEFPQLLIWAIYFQYDPITVCIFTHSLSAKMKHVSQTATYKLFNFLSNASLRRSLALAARLAHKFKGALVSARWGI